jgi:hypothetical protein
MRLACLEQEEAHVRRAVEMKMDKTPLASELQDIAMELTATKELAKAREQDREAGMPGDGTCQSRRMRTWIRIRWSPQKKSHLHWGKNMSPSPSYGQWYLSPFKLVLPPVPPSNPSMVYMASPTIPDRPSLSYFPTSPASSASPPIPSSARPPLDIFLSIIPPGAQR